MPIPLLYILLALSAVVWLLACLLLYRGTRYAAWLAGSTVSSCLSFLGLTGLASVMVPEALALLPLWLGIVVLTTWHLWMASQGPRRAGPWPGAGQGASPFSPHVPRRTPSDARI